MNHFSYWQRIVQVVLRHTLHAVTIEIRTSTGTFPPISNANIVVECQNDHQFGMVSFLLASALSYFDQYQSISIVNKI